MNVEELSEGYFYWEDIDVKMIEHPKDLPLTANT